MATRPNRSKWRKNFSPEQEAALKEALKVVPFGTEQGRELLKAWEALGSERQKAVSAWWRLKKSVRDVTPYPEKIMPVYDQNRR